MRIESFRVVNYKSFADSEEIHLEPGFNVIVGRNNVGKTALAEAVSLRFADKLHLSTKTLRKPGMAPVNTSSQAEVSVRVEAEELRELLADELPTFYLPTHPEHPNIAQASLETALSEGIAVDAVFGGGGLVSAQLSTHLGSTPTGTYMQFTVDPSGKATPGGVFDDMPTNYPELSVSLARKFYERIFSFSAVRFDIRENPISINRTLAHNASDLVQVLALLRNNFSRWNRYFKEVKAVLPEIEAISFPPSEQSGGHVDARLWNVPQDTEREDLAMPLSESGTGVGQVLAILYVAFTSDYPRTIVIDEPQSFLHPGAVRKLFEILKKYRQHQYVITTHSPNAVTAADPRALFLVRKEGEESVVGQLDISQTRDQARFLREVGASLSDVFGADNVLWVEGATEEECFPLILSKVLERQLLGTKIVGVLSTSDLRNRRYRDVYRIYKRLSEAGGLLPPAVGFIFDREGLDDTRRVDLERETGGLMVFISRRMYENYLLNPQAIAAVISQIECFREDGEVSPETVERWIEEHRWDDKYFDTPVEEFARTDCLWVIEVDGAELLQDLFDDLSGTRVAYDKVIHGVQLTRWLCDSAPEDLKELADLMVERLLKCEPDHRKRQSINVD